MVSDVTLIATVLCDQPLPASEPLVSSGFATISIHQASPRATNKQTHSLAITHAPGVTVKTRIIIHGARGTSISSSVGGEGDTGVSSGGSGGSSLLQLLRGVGVLKGSLSLRGCKATQGYGVGLQRAGGKV